MTVVSKIACVNASTLVGDGTVRHWVNGLQQQMMRDVIPAWKFSEVQLVFAGHRPPADLPWLAFLDDADAARVFGYHDLTDAGLPLSKVFIRTSRENGVEPSSVASHEAIEMLLDPWINLLVQMGRLFLAYEGCDMVEADSYDVMPTTGAPPVKVSNFALPAYFEDPPHGTRFDHLGLLTSGMPAMTPGGYLSVYVPGEGWTQQFADGTPAAARWRARPHPGSRRERRRIPVAERVRSNVLARVESP